MSEYVAKVHHGDVPNDDLASFLGDLVDASNAQTAGEVRVGDSAEASAVADSAASLRDALGDITRVTVHECRHDQGEGHCTPTEL